MACHPGVWARNCATELNPTASLGRPRRSQMTLPVSNPRRELRCISGTWCVPVSNSRLFVFAWRTSCKPLCIGNLEAQAVRRAHSLAAVLWHWRVACATQCLAAPLRCRTTGGAPCPCAWLPAHCIRTHEVAGQCVLRPPQRAGAKTKSVRIGRRLFLACTLSLFQFLLFSPRRRILQTGDKHIKLHLFCRCGRHPSLRQDGQPQ